MFLEIHPFAKLSSMPEVFQRVASDIIVCVERLNDSFQVGFLPCPIPSPAFSVAVNWPLRGFLLNLAFAFLKQAGCVIWCILNAADFTFCWFFVYFKPQLNCTILKAVSVFGILLRQLAYKHPHFNSIFYIARGWELTLLWHAHLVKLFKV